MPDGFFTIGILVYFGLFSKASGYIVRDELLLRSLVVLGTFCNVTFYAWQSPPLWESFTANAILIAINVFQIGAVVLERTIFSMSNRERHLLGSFETLAPEQFRTLMRSGAKWIEVPVETENVREGHTPNRLYFLEAERSKIMKARQKLCPVDQILQARWWS